MLKASNAWMAAAAMIAGTMVCASVGAQTMYRCGNTYQASPCETGQGRAIGRVGAPQSSYKPVSNAECAQRGADSLKIVWAREAGLILEKALAEVDGKPLSPSRKSAAKKLIADVYLKRGSAPEVRAAIEADCVAEKEQEAMAAAMYRTVDPSRQRQGPADTSPESTESTDAKAADSNRGEKMAANDATVKKAHCENLDRRLEYVYRSQRAGGDVRAMERLNQEHRDIRREQSEAGC